MRFFTVPCLIIASIALMVAPALSFQSSDSSARLQASVHHMTYWLGTGENARKWRQFLMLNHLDSQSALGDQADIGTLQTILKRFEMDVDGLESPAFVDVRNGLRRQIKFLSQRWVDDVKSEIENAKFKPLSASDLEVYRIQAVFEYQSLINYYRDKMSTRDRALLFYDIKSTETLDFLNELDLSYFIPEVMIKIPGPDYGEEDPESEADKQAAKELADKKRAALIQLRNSLIALETKNFELNDPFMTSTRLSLQRLLSVFAYSTNDKVRVYFDREIKKLKENIDSLEDPTAFDQHAIVADSLGRLESMGQMPNLVSTLRAKHSLPNFRLSISSRLINSVLSRPVVQAQPINELVLGRLVRGYAVSRGNVAMDLIDDPNQAQFSIHLNANITAKSRSVKHPVTAFTTTTGFLDARRNIYMNATGFYIGQPDGIVCLSSNFDGLNKSSKLINKIAIKQYKRDKEKSEQIGAKRTLNQAMTDFTAQTDSIVPENSDDQTGLLDKLEPIAGLLPELRTYTTTQHLLVSGHRVSSFGFGANNQPPSSFVHPDIGVQIHETFLTNYLTPYFAGKTFSNREIAEKLTEILGSVPEGLAPESEKDEFSIQFDTVQPIRFAFRESRLTIAISGKRFRQGRNNIDTALLISLNFKVIRENGKLYFKRDGNAVVDYGIPERKTARNAAFKNTLTQLINGNSENELKQELPENLIPEKDLEFDRKGIVSKLKLVQFSISNGWLQLGWDYQSDIGIHNSYTDTSAIQSEVIIKGTVDEYTPKEGGKEPVEPLEGS